MLQLDIDKNAKEEYSYSETYIRWDSCPDDKKLIDIFLNLNKQQLVKKLTN